MPAVPAIAPHLIPDAYAARRAGRTWAQIRDEFGRPGVQYQQVRRSVVAWAERNGLAAIHTPRASVASESDLTFGIEIEFRRPRANRRYTMDPQTIADALTEAGVRTVVENYNHRTRSHWKLISDGSSDRELVSPILRGEDGLRQVRAAMRVLRNLGCRVTNSEGMHVHVGARQFTATAIANIVEMYYANDTLIYSLVAPSRHSTYYCQPHTSSERDAIRSQADYGSVYNSGGGDRRYRHVNLDAYSAHGTVEFRQHQGSLNGTKATAWIRMLLGLVRTATAASAVGSYDSIEAMLEGFGVTGSARDYLVRRSNGQMVGA